MNLLPLRRLCVAVATLSLSAAGHAVGTSADDSALPDSLRRGYVEPIVGPADNTAYARGALGLIRTSYGRASLYAAWRAMQLPVGALAKESHARVSDWLHGDAAPAAGEDEITAWLQTRGGLMPKAPLVPPNYFRQSKVMVSGFGELDIETGQCGPDAFAFATRTLRELVANTALKDAERRAWITGQDAVFARCTWTPGKNAAPPLPAPMPASAPALLKALSAYQRAAALFYGDDFTAARQEFDAIVAVPGHPMRAWAALGAMRSIVRGAVRDAEWEAAYQDAWGRRQLRGADFYSATADAAASRNGRVTAALNELNARAKNALADASMAPVHAATTYTMRRALMQLSPTTPLGLAMNALDRADANPYTRGALDLFQEMYPTVSPDRPKGAMAAFLRRHTWFDFVVTVQACSDAPKLTDSVACDSEHAHALARWQESKDNTWLLATLMTARQPSAGDVAAADVARAVAPDRPEWVSLQFYAARVLRAQGRGTDAKAALEALAASKGIHKRDRALLDAERRAL